jgi:TolA-binding protein
MSSSSMHDTALGAVLANELDDRVDASDVVARTRAALLRGEGPRHRASRAAGRPARYARPALAAAVAIAAAALVVVGSRGHRAAAPVAVQITRDHAPAAPEKRVEMGSQDEEEAIVMQSPTAEPSPPVKRLPPAPRAPVAPVRALPSPSSAPSSLPSAVPAPPAPSSVPQQTEPVASSTAQIAPPSSNASLEQLLTAASEARFAGQRDAAIKLLDEVRRRAPGSDQAALAAFETGRAYYDDASDFKRAADSFDAYLRERPNGRLAREALGRAAEAHERAGDHATARRLATEYLARFPAGPQARIAWRIADGTYGDKTK